MKDTLRLADGTTLEIESGASLSTITILSPDKETVLETWGLFTDSNLKSVQIHNSNDVLIGEYAELVLENVTSSQNADGTITTIFNLRTKTDVELLQEQTKALEEQNATLSMTMDSILTEVIPSLM